jgi:oxygen-dependent protoporphyrinogen oxidase
MLMQVSGLSDSSFFVSCLQIKSLQLDDKLICVSKSHASAKNRFLYYAGKIHLLPFSILTALRTILFDRKHPLSRGKIPSTILRGIFKSKENVEKTDRWRDESIESFLTQRLGKKGAKSLPLLDYVGSAVLHGIYAADASQLSVRSIFGFLWSANRVHGNPARAVLPSFLNRRHTPLEQMASIEGDEDAKLEIRKTARLERETKEAEESLGQEYVKDMQSVSVVSFPNGIQTLTNAMIEECRKLGVTVQLGSKIKDITCLEDGIEVRVVDCLYILIELFIILTASVTTRLRPQQAQKLLNASFRLFHLRHWRRSCMGYRYLIFWPILPLP